MIQRIELEYAPVPEIDCAHEYTEIVEQEYLEPGPRFRYFVFCLDCGETLEECDSE
jgi:hypothetical protein